jgi:hypothetical protein
VKDHEDGGSIAQTVMGHLSCLCRASVLFVSGVCPVCVGHLSCLCRASVLFVSGVCPVCVGHLSSLIG